MVRTEPTTMHSISLATSYGKVIETSLVPAPELPDALRRFYARVIQYRDAVVTLNGVTTTRNSFLEFVRHFNESTTRAAEFKSAPT